MLLAIKSIYCKCKILQSYTFICITVPKHNTCVGEVSGKVNVVLRNAVKLLLLCGAMQNNEVKINDYRELKCV